MPADVGDALRANGLLRTKGPHAPGTVRRRLASWSTMHRWRGLEGPFASPALRSALRLAVRASGHPRRRKSERAVTRDILDRLTATCRSNELVDVRDLAILMAAFGSGGRRRSEIAGLRLEQLRDDPPVLSDPTDPTSTPLPCLSVRLGRTKTTEANDDAKALMIGPPASALKAWIARAKIARGPVFRAIDRWGTLEERALSPQSVNLIVKRRCAAAGLDPREFSAHGLRSGYLTEASCRGCRCRKPCSSPNMDPSNRRPAITTTRIGQRARPRGWRSERRVSRAPFARGPRVSRG
jgi:integrase